MIIAAKNGHPKCLKTLVKAEANIDQADKDRLTPWRTAVQNGNLACVDALTRAQRVINRQKPSVFLIQEEKKCEKHSTYDGCLSTDSSNRISYGK